VAILSGLGLFSFIINLIEYSEGLGITLLFLLFLVSIIVVTLIKMYAYIGDYEIFRKTKTQTALEELLDAPKGYYG
jgi:hypothetical protein